MRRHVAAAETAFYSAGPTVLLARVAFLFRAGPRVNTDAITHSIITEGSLVSPAVVVVGGGRLSLRLNNRSTAVFKKLITFLAVCKG